MGELAAYVAALWRGRHRSRTGLERHQKRLFCRFQAKFGNYAALGDHKHTSLDDFPVINVEVFRNKFSDYNAFDLTYERISKNALPQGLSAGFSTGTSGGQRGLFVTSPAERATYTAQIMARLLSPIDLVGLRKVALCLRSPNDLYRAGRLDVRFFPLSPDSASDIAAFAPDLLIAPPQVLLALAAHHVLPGLKHLYYGAETLNAVERDFITRRLGVRPDPIYQATEGFLGAPCRLGTLHLNEDSLIIEREDIGGERFRPIVTDLLRRTQAVVRLRLDDILEATTCSCGSVRQAIRPVEGRMQDIWRWPDRIIFPRDVEATVAPVIPADHPWIATGHPSGIRLACLPSDAPAICRALEVFGRPIEVATWQAEMDFPKRRHVRWQDDGCLA